MNIQEAREKIRIIDAVEAAVSKIERLAGCVNEIHDSTDITIVVGSSAPSIKYTIPREAMSDFKQAIARFAVDYRVKATREMQAAWSGFEPADGTPPVERYIES